MCRRFNSGSSHHSQNASKINGLAHALNGGGAELTATMWLFYDSNLKAAYNREAPDLYHSMSSDAPETKVKTKAIRRPIYAGVSRGFSYSPLIAVGRLSNKCSGARNFRLA